MARKKAYLGPSKNKYSITTGSDCIRREDTGYTAICPSCYDRHKIDARLCGVSRFIVLEFCPKEKCLPSIEKKQSRFDAYYRDIQRFI